MEYNILVDSLLENATGHETDTPSVEDHEEAIKEGELPEEDLETDTDMGDLDPVEESALEEFAMAQETLTEAMNIVRLNKQTRLLNLTNRTALVLARKANDPLYVKYAKFNALRLQLRAQIVKKYGTKAASYSRKMMARSATATPKTTR